MIIKKFDLQFFNEEKTEEATEKKKQDARKKGQVAQSKDVGASLSLIIVMYTIKFTSKIVYSQFVSIYNLSNDLILKHDIIYDNIELRNVLYNIILKGFIIILPILLAAMITGVLSSYFQVGFMISLESIKPKFSKISPISGFKRLFSLKSLVEMVKAILKGIVLVLIVYTYLKNNLSLLLESYRLDINQFIAVLWFFVINVILRCAGFLFFVSILDLMYKKWQHKKDLRMTKKEVKDEYKQTEGDPLLKGKIREKQRSMAMSRMMSDVPDADVVITNPTHYAVALKYDITKGSSPYVLAKGQNLIAQNIKNIAKENDVEIVENKPLARALYASTDIGQEIPEELYQAVAEVLAYVYSISEKNK